MSEPVILVPFDGSEPALAALPVAKVLGEIEHAVLHLVYVAERKSADADLPSRLKRERPELNELTIETRTGDPATEILHAAEAVNPRMIVLCKHTSVEPRHTLGSTAIKVLRNAFCPVVLVPPERGSAPWHLQHVLVPHDGTPRTSAALQPAAEIADRACAELLIAHVTYVGVAPAEPGSLATPRYVDQPQHEWPAWSNEFVKRIASVCPLGHLHVRMFLAHGKPAAEIARLVEHQSTDLMVLAWRGRWETPRAAILKEVVGEARCPVMVVRA